MLNINGYLRYIQTISQSMVFSFFQEKAGFLIYQNVEPNPFDGAYTTCSAEITRSKISRA